MAGTLDLPVKKLFAKQARLPEGWIRNVGIDIDVDGTITAVRHGEPAPADAEVVQLLVPGLPNVHSHAFQRALAGLTEQAGPGTDSFWTWRKRMYACFDRLNTADLSAIATYVYLEMLKAGYTTVGEFHYCHRLGGRMGDEDLAANSLALIHAAEVTGMAVTLLPALYMYGGFGAQPAGPEQQHFVTSVDAYLALLDTLRGVASPNLRIGLALHSLRAVAPEGMSHVLEQHASANPNGPVHVHVAEQMREVEDCLAWSGKRPIEWLLDNAAVDSRWCVVHATHMLPDEIRGLASSGAVAGLCPTTEANLGDGLFPLADYLDAGGQIAIGSDSHVSIDPWEELRWLEYGQRLNMQQRNVATTAAELHTGARLFMAALDGGARALGQPVGRIAEQYRADFLTLDAGSPLLAGCVADELLDSLVFAGGRNLVTDVMVGGQWVVRDRRHPLEDDAAAAFSEVRQRLSGVVTAGTTSSRDCGNGHP